jgi:predicted phosphodiesterase
MRHSLNVEDLTLWLSHFRLCIQDSNPKHDPVPATGRCETKPDIIVFGHTRRATIERHRGILEVDPGSPTFPDYKPALGTVSILTVISGKADVEILPLGYRLRSEQPRMSNRLPCFRLAERYENGYSRH